MVSVVMPEPEEGWPAVQWAHDEFYKPEEHEIQDAFHHGGHAALQESVNTVLCQLRDQPPREAKYYVHKHIWMAHRERVLNGTAHLVHVTELDKDGEDYFWGARVVFYRTTAELDLTGLQDALAEQQRLRERDTAVDALGRLVERRSVA